MTIFSLRQTALVAESALDGDRRCCSAKSEQRRAMSQTTAVAAGAGTLGSAFILTFYFAILTLVSGWRFTLEQFVEWWPFVLALAIGFGLQIALFVYLRRAFHRAASGKVVTATGATSTAAMVSCCTHYLVNFLPVLGATGLVSFVALYQADLFWLGIASNLAGIAYLGSRVISLSRGT
jgi:Cu+-exporting ATPase